MPSRPSKLDLRTRRHARIRATLHGTAARPRLVVSRSLKHIRAQLVDDDARRVLAASSDLKLTGGTKTERAAKVGATIAKAAKDQGINAVVFDRAGFQYHGRVKAVAEAAREAGLQF